jgi:hypothetical protein
MGYDQARNFVMYNWSFTTFAGYCDLIGEVLDQDKHAIEGAKVTLDTGLTTIMEPMVSSPSGTFSSATTPSRSRRAVTER